MKILGHCTQKAGKTYSSGRQRLSRAHALCFAGDPVGVFASKSMPKRDSMLNSSIARLSCPPPALPGRRRTVQCLEYLDGIPVMSSGNSTTCWEELGYFPQAAALTQGPCRHIPCLAMFLAVGGLA